MKKFMLLLLILLNNNLLANKTSEPQKIDTIFDTKFKTIQIEIEKLKKEHENFDYQKNFFSQALDSQKDYFIQTLDAQNNVYSINTTLFSVLITIIFGLIAFVTYWQITSKFKSEVKETFERFNKRMEELDKKYIKIESDQIIIKQELYEEKANVYITHMNIIKDKIGKIKYVVLAIKYFLLAKRYDVTLEKVKYFDIDILGKIEKEKYSEESEYDMTLKFMYEVLNLNNTQEGNEYKSEIAKTFIKIISNFSKLR